MERVYLRRDADRMADYTYNISNHKTNDAYDEREREAELLQTAASDTKKKAPTQRPLTILEELAAQRADKVGRELFDNREHKGPPMEESWGLGTCALFLKLKILNIHGRPMTGKLRPQRLEIKTSEVEVVCYEQRYLGTWETRREYAIDLRTITLIWVCGDTGNKPRTSSPCDGLIKLVTKVNNAKRVYSFVFQPEQMVYFLARLVQRFPLPAPSKMPRVVERIGSQASSSERELWMIRRHDGATRLLDPRDA